MPQQTTARTSVDITAPRMSENNSFIRLNQFEGGDDDVDGLDANEWNDDAADAIDEQVALQSGECANGRVFYAAQCQRDQGDDDERVENHRAQNGAGRTVQAHDVQWPDCPVRPAPF